MCYVSVSNDQYTVLNRLSYSRNYRKYLTVFTAILFLLIHSSTAYSQDWCAGKVTDRSSRVVPKLSKPAPLKTYTDETFGTRVTRITNAPYGTARRTLYNTVQPWNADESLLMLYHTGDKTAGHHLYDGKTYRYIRAMEFSAGDIEGIYWDEYDSDTLYFVQRRPSKDSLFGKLVKYNVKSRKRSLVADLDPICGKPSSRGGRTVRGGNDIQGMANYKIGLRCVNNKVTGKSSDITFYVDVRNGKISRRVTIDPTKSQGGVNDGFRPDVAAATLQSGERVVIQDSVFDSNMNFLYDLDASSGRYTASNGGRYTVPKLEHSTTGRMPNGNDAIFAPRFDPARKGCGGDSDRGRGAIVAYDVRARECDVIVGRSTGWGYPLSGVHLSSVSRQNPGWVAMTTIGYRNLNYLSNGKKAPLLFSELSLSYADPKNPTTCRLAHTRTFGKSAKNASKYRGGYFGEPHAVMSPSGSRVLFNSDWYDSGSVDTYAVDLGTPPAKDLGQTSSLSQPDYELSTQVRMSESPPRVYVDFVDTNQGAKDRVTIARAGSKDTHKKMWLYTNGTQKSDAVGPVTGRLGFLQQYIGRGKFEARLFTNGNYKKVVKRTYFTIP